VRRLARALDVLPRKLLCDAVTAQQSAQEVPTASAAAAGSATFAVVSSVALFLSLVLLLGVTGIGAA
jgi:hypothetical protein